MTIEPVDLAEVETVRGALITSMVAEMPEVQRQFLIGFEQGTSDRELLCKSGAGKLFAVLWKQQNLRRLPEWKRNELIDALEKLPFA